MTISDVDRATLRQLAEHGDVPAVPRPVVHYFYGEQEPLEIIADLLEAKGWCDVELARNPEEFRLTATKVTSLEDAAFETMTTEVTQSLTRLQELTGAEVEYDGWETSVEKSN